MEVSERLGPFLLVNNEIAFFCEFEYDSTGSSLFETVMKWTGVLWLFTRFGEVNIPDVDK